MWFEWLPKMALNYTFPYFQETYELKPLADSAISLSTYNLSATLLINTHLLLFVKLSLGSKLFKDVTFKFKIM